MKLHKWKRATLLMGVKKINNEEKWKVERRWDGFGTVNGQV
jgi:hypothetical protein